MTACISWDELPTDVWVPNYSLRALSRRWPEWPRGAPPTWSDFVAAHEVHAEYRRWLVVATLLRDRRHLVAWLLDCVEVTLAAVAVGAKLHHEVIAPLRAWAAGDDSVDLDAVNRLAGHLHDANTCDATGISLNVAFIAAATDADGVGTATQLADITAAIVGPADVTLVRALPHLIAVCKGTS